MIKEPEHIASYSEYTTSYDVRLSAYDLVVDNKEQVQEYSMSNYELASKCKEAEVENDFLPMYENTLKRKIPATEELVYDQLDIPTYDEVRYFNRRHWQFNLLAVVYDTT